MLTYTMSYHQISPGFLEYIFPFGQQEYSKDFHFIGFKADNKLKDSRAGLCIPELGRSGYELRLFYSLKAVESTPDQRHWPWSIRPVSVYHSFDVQTGQSTWVFVKGNSLIKKRVMELSRSYATSSFDSTSLRFMFALQVQLIMCQWAVENCASYIAFIEESLQKTTRKALHTNLSERVLQRENSTPLASPLRVSSWRSNQDSFSFHRINSGSTLPVSKKKWKFDILSRSSDLEKQMEVENDTEILPITQSSLNFNPQRSQPRMQPTQLPPNFQSNDSPAPGDQFSFGDLQYIQQLEERAQEASLVISLNQKVLTEIRQYYIDVLNSDNVPQEFQNESIREFSDDVRSLETDLSLIISRFEALLQLIEQRKQLVCFFLSTSATCKTHKPRCSASSNTASCWLVRSSARGLKSLQTPCRY
jgi:hypothetical protein